MFAILNKNEWVKYQVEKDVMGRDVLCEILQLFFRPYDMFCFLFTPPLHIKINTEIDSGSDDTHDVTLPARTVLTPQQRYVLCPRRRDHLPLKMLHILMSNSFYFL